MSGAPPLRVLVGMWFGNVLGGAEAYLRLVAQHGAAHDLQSASCSTRKGPSSTSCVKPG